MTVKKKKLILHIGSHKTGTTTLQNWLYENNAFLVQQGMEYVIAPPDRHMHAVLGFLDNDFVPRGGYVARPGLLVQQLTQSDQETVIASSENFSFFFEKQSIEVLHDLVGAHFEQIQIVVYLRRQDSHAVSHYQEGAKPERAAEEKLFGHHLAALPAQSNHLDLYLDYERRIGFWMDVFGDENVSVRVFEPAVLVGGDIVSDFLDAVGVETTYRPWGDKKNVSLGFSAVTVGRMMNMRQLPTPLKVDILNHIPADEKLLPSKAVARAFYDAYRDKNIRLNGRLGNAQDVDLFSDDFSSYPDEDKNHWSPEKSEDVIGVLLDQLKKYHVPMPIDAIRDAAIQAHQTGHGARALALMQCAVALRPSGEYIQQKLLEFTELYGEKSP